MMKVIHLGRQMRQWDNEKTLDNDLAAPLGSATWQRHLVRLWPCRPSLARRGSRCRQSRPRGDQNKVDPTDPTEPTWLMAWPMSWPMDPHGSAWISVSTTPTHLGACGLELPVVHEVSLFHLWLLHSLLLSFQVPIVLIWGCIKTPYLFKLPKITFRFFPLIVFSGGELPVDKKCEFTRLPWVWKNCLWKIKTYYVLMLGAGEQHCEALRFFWFFLADILGCKWRRRADSHHSPANCWILKLLHGHRHSRRHCRHLSQMRVSPYGPNPRSWSYLVDTCGYWNH